MKKIKEKISHLFDGSYGLDELGNVLFVFGLAAYLSGSILRNEIISTLGIVGVFIELFRMISKQKWDRSEENQKYMEFIKLWKLRFEYRKGFRVYRCKQCGSYIRVPKGKGKIQVTCKKCGDITIHRT